MGDHGFGQEQGSVFGFHLGWSGNWRWIVDRTPHGDLLVQAGLQPLIDRVEAAGMEFGIWIEPEMTNENSDLFRSHPDWILHLPPYHQPVGRYQYVLNLAHTEVSDYLFNALCKLLAQYPGIKYLKWDMNRDLTLPGGRDGRPSVHDQTAALYELLRRLRDRHPLVAIESCASGGARSDFGILEQTCRIWASDSNDAHERVRIQRGLTYFFPPIVTGSHVGPSIGHQTKRKLSLPFRCALALTGHMGIEIDLRDLSSEELSTVECWTARYKEHRALLHNGSVRRLQTGDPAIYAHTIISEDLKRFLLFVFFTDTTLNSVQGPLRITGLDPSRSYDLLLWDKPEIPSPAMERFDSALMSEPTVTVSGEFLERVGIILPVGFPDSAVILEGNPND